MNGAGIIYQPRADATPESELRTLVAIYHFILLENNASKEAVRLGDAHDHRRAVNKDRRPT
jgi:hypothetical protein